jgi:hypothetical protein
MDGGDVRHTKKLEDLKIKDLRIASGCKEKDIGLINRPKHWKIYGLITGTVIYF